MSKPDNAHKTSSTIQLKKELNQAAKILHNLTQGIEKIEASLVDSDAARVIDKRSNDAICTLQRELADCKSQCQNLATERDQDVASYANANIRLNKEYDSRLKIQEEGFKLRLVEAKQREKDLEHKWRTMLESEKAQVTHLKGDAESLRREYQAKLEETNSSQRVREREFHQSIEKLEARVKDLSAGSQALRSELTEQNTMLRGRETEISRFKKQIAGLEAFSAQSEYTLRKSIKSLQASVRDFCSLCVDSAGFFSGWQQIPKSLRHEGLPRLFSPQFAASRYVLTATMQHSLYNVMRTAVFIPYGMPVCQDINDVATSLWQHNSSHEAIWRLMMINAIVGNPAMAKRSGERFQTSAANLLLEWDIFQQDSVRKDFEKKLAALLSDTYRTWLLMLTCRNRISVSYEWDSRTIHTDTDNQSIKVPGEFMPVPEPKPLLLLSPAFLEESQSTRSTVLQPGTSMSQKSPVLLAALSEEQEISSPTLSSKEFSEPISKHANGGESEGKTKMQTQGGDETGGKD